MIEITVNKDEFITNFLNPIKKLNVNGSCSLYAKDGELISLASTEDKVCVICARFKPEAHVEDFEPVYISDVKRLILALKFIDSECITINIDNEKLFYDTKKFKFNTYLLDSKFVPKIGIKPEKIDTYETDIVFSVTKDSIKDLRVAQMIAPDATKLYFFSDEGKVYINLNDKSKSKIDNASLVISDEAIGEPFKEPFAINGSIFKMISQFNDDLVFKMNRKIGILIIEAITEKTKIKYITSALTK